MGQLRRELKRLCAIFADDSPALCVMSAVLGAIALLLTLSGIYAVLSYVVAQRTKEIGIRMAMGASVRSVTALVLRQCLRLAGIVSPGDRDSR
jgi:ABC-type antimicrobial peptide transport system permease subunit